MPKKKKEKLQGVSGWLGFFAIVLTVFTPLRLIADIFLYPEFYFYANGFPALSSILIAVILAIASIVLGVLLFREHQKSVLWIKYYLIAVTVGTVVISFWTAPYFTQAEFDILMGDLFSSILSFGIWYSYLSVSTRVKNTFEETTIGWKNASIAALVGIGMFLVLGAGIGVIESFLLPESTLIATDNSFANNSSIDQPLIDSLESGYVYFYEFEDQSTISELVLSYESSGPIDVYVVPTESDFNNYLEEREFEHYDGCSVIARSVSEMSCVVSSGGIIVYNPNSYSVDYEINQIWR